ncbi:hypothetical protein F5880DRAFT_839222 [Lentinula raphanica]|nr:hypothetical protein F5880DRAFT_839222 [Lentinula raphanica]
MASPQASSIIYTNGPRTLKGATSMDSFVDFDFPHAEQRPSHHRKGFSSPLHIFRNRKKSSGDVHEDSRPQGQLPHVRSVESLEQDPYKASRSRALPPLPRSEPASALQPLQSALSPMPLSSNGPQGIYGPLRMSPDLYSSSSSQPQYTSSPRYYYEGLPNPYESPPLHDNNSLHATHPNPPQQAFQKFDTALQENGQSAIDDSRMLDRDVAPALFAAEGIRTMDTPHPQHKQSIEIMKKIALGGATHLKQAEEALDQFTASPVWTEGKEIAQTLLEPAKDVVQIFDALAPFVPALIVAKSVFVFIVQKELDHRQNDKNMPVVLLTITKFWYTLCDSDVVFRMESKMYSNFHELSQKVVEKMKAFGNFQNLYRKHGHIVHVMKSGSYKIQIADFIDAFKDFQDQLQQLLTQASALTITNVDKKTDQLSQKLDMVIAAIKSLTPEEARVQAKIQEYGGEEKAFRSTPFLNQITESEFGVKITPQLKTILREDLSSQLKSNEAMFKLQLSATQKELEHAMERNTDIILSKLDSGPHELIRNEDVQQIWKDMKWRLSCKTRHLVDALHHYYVQKFSQFKKQTGEPHEDQWTLKFTGRIIFQPTIGDAIDSDASGYVSIDEINRFTAHCPENWSLPVFLAHAAAGWYQSALDCRKRCLDTLQKIEHFAKHMLPPNRKHLRPYFQNGCLPEIWYIVDSLNTDTFKYQQEDMRFQFEKLASYQKEFMERTLANLRRNLANVEYRMVGPEDVRAVMGTSRCEVQVLPLLMLLLERHTKIIEMADNFILAEREFQDMITSIQSVAYAFGRRYSILTEGWRQQRSDIPVQISCFSYGLFVNWHTHFRSIPFDYPDLHLQDYMPLSSTRSQGETHGPGPAKDILTYDLPLQPNAEELRRLRTSVRARNVKREEAKTRERYGNLSQRVKLKRLSRLNGNVPKSPTIRIETDNQKFLAPSSASTLVPQRRSYDFEIEDPDGVVRAINANDGFASGDSDSELPDITYTKASHSVLQDLEVFNVTSGQDLDVG